MASEDGVRPDVVTRLRALHPALLIAGLVVATTLLGLIESSQVQYDRAVQGAPITWGHALIHGLPRWYSWGVLAPFVVLATRRIAAARLSWMATIGVHLPVAASVILAQIALFSVASTVLHGGPNPLAHLKPAFLKYIGLTFFGGVVTYGALVGGWHALDLYDRYRERERTATQLELKTSELKALLAESRLQRLQAQLEPHFLFNALHALSSLMLEGETQRAVRMTSRLSELLRRALRASESPEHSLDEELSLVGDYLAIQRLRFGDRLSVDLDVDDDARDALVPALLLQPLVENAVVHGVERASGAGRVLVEADRSDGDLRIRIVNDGPPLDERQRDGMGLSNTRRRLEAVYGDEASLMLRNTAGGGVEARVVLPHRTEAA